MSRNRCLNWTPSSSEFHPSFQMFLPAIERSAAYAFRKMRQMQRVELVAEVVARAYTTFVRLNERGLTALAYPSALARYAIRQVIAGRRVGSRQNVRDVGSPSAQHHRRFTSRQLSTLPGTSWEDVLVDRKALPADMAVCRLDFRAWLAQLSHLKRTVAVRCVLGHTTGELAQQVRLSPSRISQLRHELRINWDQFHGLAGTLA